jgi:hypothetical protein
MVRTTQLVCIAALALGPAACLDDSTYDGGYAGVRPQKGDLQPGQQPPQQAQPTQPTTTTPHLDPSLVPPFRGPGTEILLPPPAFSGATSLTLIHEFEAGESWVRVVDGDGAELCQLADTGAAVTYEVVAKTCGLALPH